MKQTLLLLALLGCVSAFGQSADWTRNTYSLWPRFASNIFNISLTNGVTVNGTNTTASEVFRVQNQGTNQFRVAPNSGYTGAGTNYLSDDGTFKALNYGTGTVTSVSLIVPGGLFVSGSPVTGSGTLRILTVLTNLVKGTGAGFSNALAGVDYQAPGSYITALTGDVTASGPGSASATLANSGVTNGVYGNSANIPQFSVDSKGRITGVTNVSVTAGTTINSTDDYIPYRTSATTFGNSIYRSTSSPFNLYANQPGYIVTGILRADAIIRSSYGTSVASSDPTTFSVLGNPTNYRLQITNNAATNRTIYLGNPAYTAYSSGDLQEQMLEFMGGTGTVTLASGTNMFLSADWVPTTAGDRLGLHWDPLLNKWAEQWRYPPVGNGSATINSTDGYIPVRGSSTTFTNSPWYVINASSVGFGSTNTFLSRTNQSVFLGGTVPPATVTGPNNIVIAVSGAGGSLSSGQDNVIIGKNAGTIISSSSNNVAIGTFAYIANAVGQVAIGNAATSAGQENVSIGSGAGTGSSGANTSIGANAGTSSSSSSSTKNVALGYAAMWYNTSGSYNTFLGAESGFSNVLSSGSVLIGYKSGHPMTNGSLNTFVGYLSGTSTNLGMSTTNAIAIGANTSPPDSNTAQIGTNGVSVLYLNGTVGWFRGSGSPVGVLTNAPVGSFYSNETGGAGSSFYVVETSVGNWVAK